MHFTFIAAALSGLLGSSHESMALSTNGEMKRELHHKATWHGCLQGVDSETPNDADIECQHVLGSICRGV